MAELKQLSVYHDDDSLEQFARVRAYYIQKNDGRNVSDSQIGRELIREKDIDITNERTRSLTLAKVYAEMHSLALLNEERYSKLIQALDRLTVSLEGGRDVHR